MFTTGIKQVIVNNASQISYDATADELSILGVGKIKTSETRKADLLDTQAMVPGQYDLDMTGAYTANYAVGDLLSAGIYFSTMRNQGEFAANRKDGVDPLILQFIATTGTSTTNLATDVAAAINALSADEKARYNIVSASVVSTDSVRIVMTDWSVTVTKIEINGESGVWLRKAKASIAVVGVEGRGLPQYMEESIKTDTMANRSAYALENDMQLDMDDTYMQLNIEKGYYSYSSGSMINESPVYKRAFFNIWLKKSIFNVATLASSGIMHATAPATAGYFIGDLSILFSGFASSEDAYAEADTAAVYEDVV